MKDLKSYYSGILLYFSLCVVAEIITLILMGTVSVFDVNQYVIPIGQVVLYAILAYLFFYKNTVLSKMNKWYLLFIAAYLLTPKNLLMDNSAEFNIRISEAYIYTKGIETLFKTVVAVISYVRYTKLK